MTFVLFNPYGVLNKKPTNLFKRSKRYIFELFILYSYASQ